MPATPHTQNNTALSPRRFADQLLGALNIPVTQLNEADIVAWVNAEGGSAANGSKYNPLNIGSHTNYSSPTQGVNKTADFMRHGYGSIIAVLKQGGSHNFGAVVAATPWATGHYAGKNFLTQVEQGNGTVKPVSQMSVVEAALVMAANKMTGLPYVYGGSQTSGNHAGVDCSGLTMEAYRTIGIHLDHGASEQYKATKQNTIQFSAKNIKNLRPGDLLFYEPGQGDTPSSGLNPGHVAMYIGNGMGISAQHTGTTVKPFKLSGYMPVAATRVVTSDKQAAKISTAGPSGNPVKWFTSAEKWLTTHGFSGPTGGTSVKDNPVVKVATDSNAGMTDIAAGVSTITKANTWVRVGKVVGGFLFIAMGAFMLTKEASGAGIAVPSPVNAAGTAAGKVPGVKTAIKYAKTPRERTSEHIAPYKGGFYKIKTTRYRSKRRGNTADAEFYPTKDV